MSRVTCSAAAFAAALCVVPPAHAQEVSYEQIPATFRGSIRPGLNVEQFLLAEMNAFRASARDGVELDPDSVDTARRAAAARARALATMSILAADLDNDGKVSREEAARPAGADVRMPARGRGDWSPMSFDANGDGVLDQAEIREAATRQAESTSAGVPAGDRFLALIADGRKVLRAAEAVKAAEAAFAIVDRDADTIISATEFTAFSDALGLSRRRPSQARPVPPPSPPPERGPEEEAYLVGVYEGITRTMGSIHGPRALVAVDRPRKPVTLILCSAEPVQWAVTLTPGTALKELRAFGNPKSEVLVDGAPAKPIPLGAEIACPYERKGPAFRRFVGSLKELAGFQQLAGFAGSYTASTSGFILDERTGTAAPQRVALTVRDASALPAIRFPADLKDGPGLYDLAGRIVERGVRGDGYGAVDVPGRDERYKASHDELIRTRTKGPLAERNMIRSLDAPPLSWPTGIAFDDKRNRVVVVSLGGEGFLYELDLASEKWRVIASMRNRDVAGLFYERSSDRLWARQGDSLIAISADGAIDRQLSLNLDKAPGLRDFIDDQDRGAVVRLAAAENGKAVLVASSQAGENRAYRIYLVDLASGDVELTAFAG